MSQENAEMFSRRGFLVVAASTVLGGSIGGAYWLTKSINDTIIENRNIFLQNQRAILHRHGLDVPRPLIDPSLIPGFSFKGGLTGSIIEIVGTAEGGSDTKVHFWWVSGDSASKMIESEISHNKALYAVLDDESTKPSVLFKPNLNALSAAQRAGFDSDNPNDFLVGDRLSYATFTLSKKDFGNFRIPR